mmetsp:Transcript_14429/g.17470  ORF Transcript_14429/g.17470 Transcript_14429/m.17470 type:complete len:261 (+) Transcript_14429:513-1295(+)
MPIMKLESGLSVQRMMAYVRLVPTVVLLDLEMLLKNIYFKQKKVKDEEIQQEQELRDALRSKDWQKALTDALDLDRPYTAFQILQRASTHSIDQVIQNWPITKAQRLLKFIREWNTDATKAFVAHLALAALIHKFGHADLFANDYALSQAIDAYTRRHIKRIESLHRATYLIDHALGSMQRTSPLHKKKKVLLENNLPTEYPDDLDITFEHDLEDNADDDGFHSFQSSSSDDDDDGSSSSPSAPQQEEKVEKRKKKKQRT